jgi:ATP-dependent Clp protease ATP-binding subunit ClpC
VAKRRSDDARTLLERARKEAGGLKADYVGTEHLLLALLADHGPAGRALAAIGVDPGKVRERATAVRPPAVPVGRSGLTTRTDRVLELAEELAEERGLRQPEARDVLVALVRGDGGPGARILRDLGISSEQVEDAVDEAAAGS